MAISKKILDHLNLNKVKFNVVEHKKVFTAFDLAQTLGEKLEKIGKSLLVQVELPALKKKGKNYFVLVLPASYRVDFEKVKKVLKATKVEMVPEKVFKKLGIEPGAMIPFGSLHKAEVLMDKALLKARDTIFSAGNFTESLRLKTKDLHKLENALVAAIGVKIKSKPAKKAKAAPKKKKSPAKKTAKKKK